MEKGFRRFMGGALFAFLGRFRGVPEVLPKPEYAFQSHELVR